MHTETTPLSNEEVEHLIRVISEPRNGQVHDLLRFSGVQTAAGLVIRVIAASEAERALLLTAIRRLLAVEAA